jgi:protocatechuate 3,4-dioxygenase alpha subunit
MSLQQTTSQTVGPYFHIGLTPRFVDNLAPEGVKGERVTIAGRVLDGEGKPINDALIELWQANAAGKYDHPEDTQDKPLDPLFRGFGRVATDDDGRFRFTTIKPGRVPGPGGKLQAPHILVSVFMRGALLRSVSRIYFPNEPSNQEDFILNLVEPARRGTLIARPINGRKDMLEWNIVMQGEDETVFFDF